MTRQAPLDTITGPSEGFSFVLRYGLDEDVLDTEHGTFTREVIYPTRHTVTVEMKFTPQELAQVEKSLDEIDYWNIVKYPSEFSPRRADDIFMAVTPSPTYILVATRRGITKKITWHDNNGSDIPEAANLRNVLRVIIAIVEAKSEYGKLPSSQKAHF